MEPTNNFQLNAQKGTRPFATTATDANGADIFSTLCNLAAANTSNFNTSTSQILFPSQFQTNSVSWPSTTSNNWFDQAKLSLLPMYGLLQSTGNPNELSQNSGFPIMDHSIQQAAASFNVMENLQSSFGQFYGANANSNKTSSPNVTNIQSSMNETNNNNMQRYSHQTTSTAQTHGNVQNEQNNQSMEEFTEFDLQDFEDLLMDKPSSYMQPESQQSSSYSEKDVQNTMNNNNTLEISQPPFRFEEFTNADKELDRLVSLVASQNTEPRQQNPDLHSSLPSTSNQSIPNSSSAGFSAVLEAPQFTPPNSPTNFTQNSFGKQTNSLDVLFPNDAHREIKNDPFKSTMESSKKPVKLLTPKKEAKQPQKQVDSLLLIPKEQIKVDPARLNRLALARKNNNSKIPIYKQKMVTSMPSTRTDFVPEAFAAKLSQTFHDDAFSFDDELDENPILTSPPSAESIPKTFRAIEKQSSEQQQRVKRKYTRRSDSTIIKVETNEPAKEQKQAAIPMLAEQIRRRKAHGSFLSTEIAADDNAAVCDVTIATCTLKNDKTNETSNNASMPLPKLIIRIPRRESKEEGTPIEIIEKTKKKHKKRKSKDLDWTETEECKFVKHKKHKDRKHKKEHKKHRKHSESFDELAPKKREEIDGCDRDYGDQKEEQSTVMDMESTSQLVRLHYFERPTEKPKRGTFLLAKADLFKPECSMWRIDNQNLLQKYLPITLEDGTIAYQNSQTYSGWCEQFVDDYMAIKVEYVKQSRSENIVRPYIPLQDLFPAINSSLMEESTVQKRVKFKLEESVWNTKDQSFRNHFCAFVNIMIKHCITLQFINDIKQSNDWNYLCTLTEMELQTNNCLKRTQLEQWSAPFLDALKNFPRIFLVRDLDSDLDEEQSCQACLIKCLDVKQAIQLFADEMYDLETFVPKRIANFDSSTCTIDFYVCRRCADAALKYHKVYHLRYSIFKACEEKVELMSAEQPELSADQVIDKCAADREWTNNLFNEASDTLQR